jgi:hypothetical protein
MISNFTNNKVKCCLNSHFIQISAQKTNDTMLKNKKIHKTVKIVLIYDENYCSIKYVKKSYIFHTKFLYLI